MDVFSWEQREFNYIFDILQNNTLSRADLSVENGVVGNVHYGDILIKYGEILDLQVETLTYIQSEEIKNKFKSSVLHNGDIIIADTAEDETVGKCTEIANLNGIDVLAGLHTIPLRPKQRYANGYLGYYMNSNSYHDTLLPLMQGTKVTSISKSALQGTVVNCPIEYDEQAKVGQFFTHLDRLITLHQREYFSFDFDSQSAIIAQNTFSWEQRKFSDVVATRRGLTYKPSDIRKNGVRVLRSSNIAEDSFTLSNEDVFVVREAVNIDCARANDILITAANGSSRLVGKHTIISGIPEESAVHGGFMLLGTTKEPHFVNASMGSSWYRRFIELFVAGGNGAIGNLNKNDLDNQEIAIPSEEEQKKIGSFFRQLDNLITLHQHKPNKKGHDVLTVMPFKGNQRKPHYLCT